MWIDFDSTMTGLGGVVIKIFYWRVPTEKGILAVILFKKSNACLAFSNFNEPH